MKRKIISTVLIAGMVMTGCSATGTPEATTASATEAATEAAAKPQQPLRQAKKLRQMALKPAAILRTEATTSLLMDVTEK